MKTLLLVAGGRGGSDFFQGLLDGHSQILSLPLYLRIDKEFFQMLALKDSKKLAENFIKLYPEFFDSRINKFERWDKLGKNKNLFFSVNKKKFVKDFIDFLKNKKMTEFDKIKFLHLAYSKAKGENTKKKKLLFIHTHLVSWTKNFVKRVNPPNTEIIHIIRHPLASLSSPIKNWLNFENGKNFYPKDLYFQLDLVFNGIYDLMLLRKVNVIQYEHIHWNFKKTIKDFCRIYKIKFEKCLRVSTKNGLTWWGDVVSKKWLSGINKNFKIKIDENYFFSRDLIFFQFINNRIIKRYNYKHLFLDKRRSISILPLKCELLVWKNTLKHLFLGFRWKHFLSIPYFYFLRIICINAFMVPNKKLPYAIGSKK